MALDENVETFVVYVVSLTSKITIYSARKAQIALLLAENITVLAEYADFINVFLKKSAKMLPERTDINEHAIKIKESKQLAYRPICSLGSVELEILKTYIIWPTVLFNLWRLLLVFQSYLFVSLIVVSGCASITRVLTIWPSKADIYFRWLVSL